MIEKALRIKLTCTNDGHKDRLHYLGPVSQPLCRVFLYLHMAEEVSRELILVELR